MLLNKQIYVTIGINCDRTDERGFILITVAAPNLIREKYGNSVLLADFAFFFALKDYH